MVGPAHDATARPSLRPRLGAVSFLHRFGSALNRHVHLHACVTDGLFMPDHAGVAFLPARPVTPADLATLTERVRRRFLRWFLRTRLLDAEAAADMLAWEKSGFSVDASVRVALVDRDVPSYFRSLEHLLRYCARPAFALERLSLLPRGNGGPERIRYSLPRHKRGQWVGPGRKRKATDPAPIRKILLHLGEPLEPTPLAPARGPPTSWDELVQVHDDRDAIQASPDDLPVIDIRSL